MKIDIKIPAMGESISEATIGQILKPNGSQVALDEEILELETDKVNQVMYAPQAGTLNLTVKANDVVKIGQVVGHIDGDINHSAQKEYLKEQKEETAHINENVKQEGVSTPISEENETKIRFSKEDFAADVHSSQQLVKEKEQKEEKVDVQPETLKTPSSLAYSSLAPAFPLGEKHLGKISSDKEPSGERDPKEVHSRELHPKETLPRETRRKMSKIRKVIAQRLVEAQHTTAMLTTFNEVDLSQVMALREKYKDSFLKMHQIKLGFMSFFVQAAVSALKAFPDINSYIDADEIVHREYYDIGIAVGTDKGLVVPVVRESEQLSFAKIEQAIESLAKKAREGKLSIDDLQGGGFTITNGGTYGSLLSTPIINFPQSAILGMHKIEKRPVVVNDEIVIRPMMYLALSYDHRIIDGKEAVSFLVHIKNLLEDPSRLLLEI